MLKFSAYFKVANQYGVFQGYRYSISRSLQACICAVYRCLRIAENDNSALSIAFCLLIQFVWLKFADNFWGGPAGGGDIKFIKRHADILLRLKCNVARNTSWHDQGPLLLCDGYRILLLSYLRVFFLISFTHAAHVILILFPLVSHCCISFKKSFW